MDIIKSIGRTLFPGAEITLPSGVRLTVYPIAFRHLRKFGGQVASLIHSLTRLVGTDPGRPEALGGRALAVLAPTLLEDFAGLLGECIVIHTEGVILDDLPHWEVAPVLEAWISESFGTEEKRRPLVQLAQSLVKKLPSHAASPTPSSSSPATDTP